MVAGQQRDLRWLLARVSDEGRPDEAALARKLLRAKDPGFSESFAHQQSTNSGHVWLTGQDLHGEVSAGCTESQVDIEIDGRFSRFDLPSSSTRRKRPAPRAFRLTLPAEARVVRVGVGGRQLSGSPFILSRGVDAFPTAPPCPPDDLPWILIPVYGAAHAVRRCLQSVWQAHCRLSYRILVVDDATPDPTLRQWLQARAAEGRITLLQRPLNGGFVAAVNTGFRYLGARDTLLLNSDTVVSEAWLDRLCLAAYSSPQIGAVNPLSNNAELISLPDPMQPGVMPNLSVQDEINRILRSSASAKVVDAPAGVGFCWSLKGESLASIGLMDETLVEGGYGEDTDYSVRLQKAGWRLAVALDTYVAHEGSRSFGLSKQQLAFRNVPLLHCLHPAHELEYQHFLDHNPLEDLNRHLQRALLTGESRPARGAVLRVTHSAQMHRRQRFLATAQWALVPVWDDTRLRALALVATETVGISRIEYVFPEDAQTLAQDLVNAGFAEILFESFADWTPEALGMLAGLPISRTASLIDASSYCPRQHAHVSALARCEEPAALSRCESCLATHGRVQRGVSHLASWRRAVAELLAEAASRNVADPALATRLTRRFGGAGEFELPSTDSTGPLGRSRLRRFKRIGIVGLRDHGAGFGLVHALARRIDAAGAALRLVVVGRTFDDARLAACECVELPGELPKNTLAESFTMFECDALADPAFFQDGLVPALAARLRLPCLDREALNSLLTRLPAAR